MDLTKRQQEIFDFIKQYSNKHGYPPTVRDIGKAVGLASSSTVHAHLANLERIGLLRRDPSKPRAIELLDRAVEGVKSLVTPSDGLPLVGSVAAGQPILAEENIEDHIVVPSEAAPRSPSSARSISLWYGNTTCARSETTSRPSRLTPRRRRSSTSSRSVHGSTTTPFPITFMTPGWSTPDGRRWRTYFSWPTITVWPAFAPPW